MENFELPKTQEELHELTLALDAMIGGLEGAITMLNSARNFDHILRSSDGVLSEDSFQLVQEFISTSQDHLSFPQEKKVVLEYYNDRPLRQLAIESLEGFMDGVIKAVRATFRFIVDCLKAIFFISSKKALSENKDKLTTLEENYKEMKAEVEKRLAKKGTDINTFTSARAKSFGIEKGPLKQPDIANTLSQVSSTITLMEGTPKKLVGIAEEAIKLMSSFEPDVDNSKIKDGLDLLVKRMRGLLSHLHPLDGTLKGFTRFPDGAKVVVLPLVPGYEALEVLLPSDRGSTSVQFKRLKNDRITPTSEVALDTYDLVPSIVRDVKELNTKLDHFVAEVDDANRDIKSLEDKLTKLLEGAAKGSAGSKDSEKAIFKTVKEITAGLLSHTLLFAALYKESLRLSDDTINIFS